MPVAERPRRLSSKQPGGFDSRRALLFLCDAAGEAACLSSRCDGIVTRTGDWFDRCDVRLLVRSPVFQAGKAGSTPVRRADRWRGTQTGKAASVRAWCLWVQLPPNTLMIDRCPVLRLKRWPSEGRLASSTLAWGNSWVVSRLRAPGLRSPVGRFDSCTTYSVARPSAEPTQQQHWLLR